MKSPDNGMQYSPTGTLISCSGILNRRTPWTRCVREPMGLGLMKRSSVPGLRVRLTKRCGWYGKVGVPPEETMEDLPFKHSVQDEIVIFGSRAGPNVARKVIALMSSGQLKISDLITHTSPLTEFRRALDTFVNRRDGAIKVVIEPNGKEGK